MDIKKKKLDSTKNTYFNLPFSKHLENNQKENTHLQNTIKYIFAKLSFFFLLNIIIIYSG